MKNNPKIETLFNAAHKDKVVQLAKQYSSELVFQIWEELGMAGGHDAYFGVCGWKLR